MHTADLGALLHVFAFTAMRTCGGIACWAQMRFARAPATEGGMGLECGSRIDGEVSRFMMFKKGRRVQILPPPVTNLSCMKECNDFEGVRQTCMPFCKVFEHGVPNRVWLFLRKLRYLLYLGA